MRKTLVLAAAMVLLAGCGRIITEGSPRGWLQFYSMETVYCDKGLERLWDSDEAREYFRCTQHDGVTTFRSSDVRTAKFLF